MEKEEFYYDVQTCIQMLKEIHPLLSDAKDALDSIGCEYTRENVYLAICKICAALQDEHTQTI